MGSKVPFLLGFVHLLRKNAPSLINSRGTSSSCFTWSDISRMMDTRGKKANVAAKSWRYRVRARYLKYCDAARQMVTRQEFEV